MTQDIYKQNNYIAEEGKTFVSKLDKSRIGWIISIGAGDSIDNYTEEDMTEDELALKNELETENLPKLTTPTVKTVGFLGQACSTLLP